MRAAILNPSSLIYVNENAAPDRLVCALPSSFRRDLKLVIHGRKAGSRNSAVGRGVYFFAGAS